jgi:hypothetical protein
MPRAARHLQWTEAACYHVRNRGHARETVFQDDEDPSYFLHLLARWRNPLAARRGSLPWAYRWSSCRAYAQAEHDALLAPNPWYETCRPNRRPGGCRPDRHFPCTPFQPVYIQGGETFPP